MIEVTRIAIQGSTVFWAFSLVTLLVGFAVASVVHNLRSRRRCVSCDALLRERAK